MTSTAEAALSRFRELLQIPTVSRTDESEIDWQPFDDFLVEAVEQLVADGFTSARDVYLSFGHNEETAGGGARAIVALLDERDIRPGLVLDEGGAVVDGAVPGVGVPTAMVGVAERGVMTLLMTARETGGHASTPPAMPDTARLARGIDRLRRHPFPTRIARPCAQCSPRWRPTRRSLCAGCSETSDSLAPSSRPCCREWGPRRMR